MIVLDLKIDYLEDKISDVFSRHFNPANFCALYIII